MAKSKRLTRKYRIGAVMYGPETPIKDIPEQLLLRERQLATPEEQLKIARRFGTAATLSGSDLVPDKEVGKLVTVDETAPLPADAPPPPVEDVPPPVEEDPEDGSEVE
jgi:hypothetical protein